MFIEELAKTILFEANSTIVNEHINAMTDMIITRQPQWEKYRELIIQKVERIADPTWSPPSFPIDVISFKTQLHNKKLDAKQKKMINDSNFS